MSDLSEIPPRLLPGFEVGFCKQRALALRAVIKVGAPIGPAEIEAEFSGHVFEIIDLKL
jgi:hypothetical protein